MRCGRVFYPALGFSTRSAARVCRRLLQPRSGLVRSDVKRPASAVVATGPIAFHLTATYLALDRPTKDRRVCLWPISLVTRERLGRCPSAGGGPAGQLAQLLSASPAVIYSFKAIGLADLFLGTTYFEDHPEASDGPLRVIVENTISPLLPHGQAVASGPSRIGAAVWGT